MTTIVVPGGPHFSTGEWVAFRDTITSGAPTHVGEITQSSLREGGVIHTIVSIRGGVYHVYEHEILGAVPSLEDFIP